MNKEHTLKLYGWKPEDGDYSVKKELQSLKKKRPESKISSAFLKSFIYNMERLKREVFIDDKL